MTRPTVSKWRSEVCGSALITDSTRALLLVLADRMGANMKVSVPRAELAKLFRRHPRRISERLEAACEAGLLYRQSNGYRGHTAVYEATMPPLADRLGADPEHPIQSPNRHPISSLSPDMPGERVPGVGTPYIERTRTEVAQTETLALTQSDDSVVFRHAVSRGRETAV